MLDIWKPSTEAFVTEILKYHLGHTGELLDIRRVTAYHSDICPYKDWDLVRLEILPHVVKRSSGNITILAKSISYFLIRRGHGEDIEQMLPFHQNMDSVIAINRICNLKLTRSTLESYVTILGLMMSDSTFYFISNINQISTLLKESTDQAEANVLQSIEALFKVNSKDGCIDTNVSERSYPLLGRVFSARLPCIYSGCLFASNLRIAENGTPHMDDDQPINIEGIKDRDAQFRFFPLDLSNECMSRYACEIRHQTRWNRRSTAIMSIERISSILLFPLFLFTIITTLLIGQDNPQIIGYYSILQTSHLLTLSSLVIGVMFLVTFSARLVLISILDLTNSLVPSDLGRLVHEIRTSSVAGAKKLGIIRFMSINVVEFGISAVLARTMVSYGVFNVPTQIPGVEKLNFWDTFIAVIWAVPLLGDWLMDLFATSHIRAAVKVGITSQSYFNVVGFIFSTVLVGWLTKLFTYSREGKNK